MRVLTRTAVGVLGGLLVSGAARAEEPPRDCSGPIAHQPEACFPAAVELSGFTGLGIDTFAASDVRRYLNPEAEQETQERFVAGVDFSYRLLGGARPAGPRLFLFGETVHGVRSAEVDCSGKTVDVCADPATGLPREKDFFAILRGATSLEAFIGLRLEFLTLQPRSDHPARLYVKSQAGFLKVAGLGDDLQDSHAYAALGLALAAGPLQGSYLEVGFGRSDVLRSRRTRRIKIDGFLSLAAFGDDRIRPFVQLNVDSDFGGGADSIHSYVGLDFDLGRLFSRDKTKAALRQAASTPRPPFLR